ncbi:MAG: FG-GAP-like repeat-containing protein [Chloroflexota bacterium]
MKHKTFIPNWCPLVLAFVLALSSLGLQPGAVHVQQAAAAGPQPGDNEDWLAQAQEYIRQSEYQISWEEEPLVEGAPASFQAPNRAQDLRFYFQENGLQIVRRTESEPSWVFRMVFRGVGNQSEMAALQAPALNVDANRIAYHRGNLVESYTNSELGLEQTLILDSRPVSKPDSPLALEVQFSGGLTAQRMADGGLEFQYAGQPALHYGSLRATDAEGRSLAVQEAGLETLETEAGEQTYSLHLVVDDQEASYPLLVSAMISGVAILPDWYRRGNQEGAWFGYSVATAGDVNGDGYSDIIIGAPFYDGGLQDNGKVYVFQGSSTGSVGTPSWSKSGEHAEDNFGISVATAGDVNGDGYSDVIVGAMSWDNGSQELNEGKAFVYHGSASGLNSAAAWSFEGDQESANLGFSVACAGDVNGDGYSEVIVGAPMFNTGYDDAGRAYVFQGSSGGLSSTPAFYRDGTSENSRLGISVATAGDVNADGYAEVLISERFADSGGYSDNGRVYVFFGASAGLSHASYTTLAGYQDYEELGVSVSTAGDVNGDGYSDVIIGSDLNIDAPGAAYVYYGAWYGLDTSPAWYIEGSDTYGYLGHQVATAGDVNADGYADILVGHPNYDGLWQNQGRALIWLGSSTGLGTSHSPESADWDTTSGAEKAGYGASVATAGDVNGDGYSDVIIGAPGYSATYTMEGCAYVFFGGPDNLSNVAGWSSQGGHTGDSLGYSVATAGDVNGDGYADVIVGAPGYDGSNAEEGAIYVWFGSMSGLGGPANWWAYGGNAQAQLGGAVDSAGDVNGDGYEDIIAGAQFYSNGNTGEGMVLVWLGSASGLGPTGNPGNADWKAESNQDNAQMGSAVAGAGDVNGDGYADVAVGVHHYTNGQSYEGLALAWYGGPGGLGADGNPTNADWRYELDTVQARLGGSLAGAGDVNRDGYSDLIAAGVDMAAVWYGSPTGLYEASANWTAHDISSHFGAVDTAGDINGDGYSDVIIGSPLFSGFGGANEGRALAYCGSASGLGFTECWVNFGGSPGAQYGASVATAGDVNGDGYADILVGAPKYSAMETEEGNARLYYGSATGPTSCTGVDCGADWWYESDSPYARLGTSVASGGDVNGDGYADVLIGAPDLLTSGMGSVSLFYGNGAPGKPVRPRQIWMDYSPIARLGMSASRYFMMQAFAFSPTGRGDFKLKYEVDILSSPFDGIGAVTAGAWADTNLGGTAAVGTYLNLVNGQQHHWRIRFKYSPVTNPFNPPYSRWYHQPWNGWNEADLRGPFYQVYIPLAHK